MIPDWLHNAVIDGLQKLLALRLPGTPAAEAVGGTAMVWLEAIDRPGMRWDEEMDMPRVQRAFRALFATCDRWPAPKLFIQHLGNRDPPPALPAPRMSPEELARNRQRVRDIAAMLAGKMASGPEKPRSK